MIEALAWIGWAGVVAVQKGLNTLAQRAKNGESLKYSGYTALLSDGVYICTLGFTVTAIAHGSHFWAVAAAYTAASGLGTITFHKLALDWGKGKNENRSRRGWSAGGFWSSTPKDGFTGYGDRP